MWRYINKKYIILILILKGKRKWKIKIMANWNDWNYLRPDKNKFREIKRVKFEKNHINYGRKEVLFNLF